MQNDDRGVRCLAPRLGKVAGLPGFDQPRAGPSSAHAAANRQRHARSAHAPRSRAAGRARPRHHVAAQRRARDRPSGPADLRNGGRRHRHRFRLRPLGRPDALRGGLVPAVRAGLRAGGTPWRSVGTARDDAGVLVRHRRRVPRRRGHAERVADGAGVDAARRVRVHLPSGRHPDAGARDDPPGCRHRRQRAGRQPRDCRGRRPDRPDRQVFRLADGVRDPRPRVDRVGPVVRAHRAARTRAARQTRAQAVRSAARRARARRAGPDAHVDVRKPRLQLHDQRQRRAHERPPARHRPRTRR